MSNRPELPDPTDNYRPLTLALTETQGATFAAIRSVVNVKMDDIKITGLVWRFHSRLDDQAVLIYPDDCLNMPVAFHASLQASAAILRQYYARGLKYEGDETMRFNPRGILQHYARMYGVEVDHVAGFYVNARAWLSHKDLDHPTTLNGVINAITIKQTRRLS